MSDVYSDLYSWEKALKWAPTLGKKHIEDKAEENSGGMLGEEHLALINCILSCHFNTW